MEATLKPSSKFPAASVVVPKMEFPTSSGSNGLHNVGQPPKNMAISPEDKKVNISTPDTNPGNDELANSEMQLVSSLAKLQKMESMIHQLRTLLPERLLEPLAPIVNPKAAAGRSIPNSPQKLYEQLSQAARDGVAEVAEFQNMWRSPELKVVWDRVDTDIKENNGQLLQPTGVWDHDYNTMHEQLVKQDQTQKDQQLKTEEELDSSKIQAAQGDWKPVVEAFSQKNIPGVRLLPSSNETSFFALLGKAGLAFKIHAFDPVQGNGVPEWQVSSKPTSGQPISKLETAILACLNSRPRKWDLSYLLDMISSYSNLKQTPCIKCGKMTDNTTSLPTYRHPKPTETSDPSPATVWKAYHVTCAE